MKKFCLILSLFLIVSCTKQVKLNMRILSYSGKVTVNTTAVTEINMVLKQDDAVETMADSTCDIIINDKNILRLKPDTKLTLKISETENILKLDKGWLAGVTRKVFTSGGKFIIQTPTLTAAVRGTSFCLKVENEKSTYFCTCNGSIELTGKNSSQHETVEAAHHAARKFTFDKTGALIEDNTPGLLYHNDRGVEEMAKIIGETIDWSKPDIH